MPNLDLKNKGGKIKNGDNPKTEYDSKNKYDQKEAHNPPK